MDTKHDYIDDDVKVGDEEEEEDNWGEQAEEVDEKEAEEEEEGEDEESSQRNRKRKRKVVLVRTPAQPAIPGSTLLSRIQAMLRSKGDTYTTVEPKSDNFFVGRTNPNRGRECLISGEDQPTSNCSLLFKPNGEVWYYCHNSRKNCVAAEVCKAGQCIGYTYSDFVQFTNSSEDGGVDMVSNNAPGTFTGDVAFVGLNTDAQSPSVTRIVESKREYGSKKNLYKGTKSKVVSQDWKDCEFVYDHSDLPPDNVRCRKIRPTFGTRCYCIQAGMSLGKTHQIVKYLSRFLAANPRARVLIVSTRIAFGISQKSSYADFHVSHYADRQHYGRAVKDLQGHVIPNRSVWSADRLIVQYESLHNLKGQDKFDIVILDEARSLMSNMCCPATNPGPRLRQNANTLRWLLKSSTMAFCMDADLAFDGALPNYLKSLFPSSQIEVHRYAQQRMVRSLSVTDRAKKIETEIRDTLEGGEKVAICCRTKTQARIYEKMFSETYKSAVFVAGDPLLKKLEDIDTFLREDNIQLVILTSCITVGADIQEPFGRVFVDFRGSDGCTARNIMQMVGRFRVLSNTQVRVLVGREAQFIPNLYQHAHDYVMAKERLTDECQHRMEATLNVTLRKLIDKTSIWDFEPAADDQLIFAPDWMSQLFLFSLVEQAQNQEYLLYAHSRQRGWDVHFDEIPLKGKATESTVAKKAKKDVKAEKKAQKSEIIAEIKVMDARAITDLVDGEKRAKMTSDNPSKCDERVHIGQILRDYATPDSEGKTTASFMTDDDVKFVEKNKKQIWNYALLMSEYHEYDVRDQAQRQLSKITKASYPDLFTPLPLQEFAKLNEALQLLGHHDEPLLEIANETLLPLAQFEKQEELIIQLMKDCAYSGGRQKDKEPMRKNTKSPGKTAHAVLKAELKAVWGMRLERVRIGRQKIHIGYKLAKNEVIEQWANNMVPLLQRTHDQRMEREADAVSPIEL